MKHSTTKVLAFAIGLVGLTAATPATSSGPPAPYCGPGHQSETQWTTKAYDENDQWLASFFTDTQAEGQAECQAFLDTYQNN